MAGDAQGDRSELARAALVANPKVTAYDYFLRVAEAMASSLSIELVPSPIENAADIERTVEYLRGRRMAA